MIRPSYERQPRVGEQAREPLVDARVGKLIEFVNPI